MVSIVESIADIVSTNPAFRHRQHGYSGNTRALASSENRTICVLFVISHPPSGEYTTSHQHQNIACSVRGNYIVGYIPPKS